MAVEVGQYVAWKWGFGVAEGKVLEVKFERTEIISKGVRVVRNGSSDNPAVIIDHKSGNQVLKLESELMSNSN